MNVFTSAAKAQTFLFHRHSKLCRRRYASPPITERRKPSSRGPAQLGGRMIRIWQREKQKSPFYRLSYHLYIDDGLRLEYLKGLETSQDSLQNLQNNTMNVLSCLFQYLDFQCTTRNGHTWSMVKARIQGRRT